MKSYVLIIMKPDALNRDLVAEILRRFIESNFQIEMISYQCVNEALIINHYSEVIKKLGDAFAETMKRDYIGKSMIPIILSQNGHDAIKNARRLTGTTDPSKADPETIRGDLGQDSLEQAALENRICQNLIHCCDSQQAFKRELAIWFDQAIVNWHQKNAKDC